MPRRYSSQDLALLAKDGLAAQLPEPPVRKKRGDPEGAIQRDFVRWWDNACVGFGVPHRLLFSIPNGAVLGSGNEEYQIKHRQIRGRMLKLAGLRSGVPDLLLSVPSKGYHGCYIEMKDAKGVVSKDQTEVGVQLLTYNYQVHVCRSAEEAINCITTYLT